MSGELVAAIVAGTIAVAALVHDVLNARRADRTIAEQAASQSAQADAIGRLLAIEERRAAKEAAVDAEAAAQLEEERREVLRARRDVAVQPTARNEPRRIRVWNQGQHAATVRRGTLTNGFITEEWTALPADLGPDEALSWPVQMARGQVKAEVSWTDGTGEHTDTFTVDL